jgi:hypothetical protein
MQCSNNLKQLGLALHTYLDTHKTFPAQSFPVHNGQNVWSWAVSVFPFIEQTALYDILRPGVGHVGNNGSLPAANTLYNGVPLLQRTVSAYICPSDSSEMLNQFLTNPRNNATAPGSQRVTMLATSRFLRRTCGVGSG